MTIANHGKKRVWTCSIGPAAPNEVGIGDDFQMREAVRRAFVEITGHEPDHLFSGWGGFFNADEEAYINAHNEV